MSVWPWLLLVAVVVCSTSTLADWSSESGTFLVSCTGECADWPAASPPAATSRSRPLVGLFGGAMAPGELIASDDVPLFAQLLRATGYSCDPYAQPACRPQATVLSLTTDSNCSNADWLAWNPFWTDAAVFDPETILPRTAVTLCFVGRPPPGSADWQRLVAAVQAASLVWFTGGDQSTYYRYWADSPLAAAVSSHVRVAGRPVGGESAGLAVLGNGAVFAALAPRSLNSKEALLDPYGPLVTLTPAMFDFGAASGLQRVVTDTHFMQRNRMGRLLTFASRLRQDGNLSLPVGLGVSEHTGFLLDAATGTGLVGGRGPVNVVVMANPPARCHPDRSLLLVNVSTIHLDAGAAFDLLRLAPVADHTARQHTYYLSVDERLQIISTDNNGRIY